MFSEDFNFVCVILLVDFFNFLRRTSSVEEIRESIGDLIDEYIDQNTRLAAEQISQTGGKKIQSGERSIDLVFF
jgi:hypothetical protein